MRCFFYLVCFFSFFLTTFFSIPALSEKPQKDLLINGAGASFPYILYSKWFSEYRKKTPNIKINYRSIGSGGGIRQLLAGTLDFGASDVILKTNEIKKLKKEIVQIPTTLGAVVVSYHLPSLKDVTLKLTADVLSDIYMGKIQKWNDEKIVKLNSKVNLPDQNILPVYRADGSGTTAVFTEYLAQFSSAWIKTMGKGKSINWKKGIGGKGNEGVMGLIKKMPGAIGYIGMSYAQNRGLPMAEIENKSGHFVKANQKTVMVAATQILDKKNSVLHSLVGAEGQKAYPLSAYTYLLVYKKMDSFKGKALVGFLNWFLDNGQSFCAKLHYVPLPVAVVKKVRNQIKLIQVLDNDQNS